MKEISYPSTGGVDSVFTPHPDCTMLYTEQLSWCYLKFLDAAYLAGFKTVNFNNTDGDTKTPAEFHSLLTALSNLSELVSIPSIANEINAGVTEIGDLGIEVQQIRVLFDAIKLVYDLFPDSLDIFKKLYQAYDSIFEDSEGNPVDGLADLMTHTDADLSTFASWLQSALVAFEGESPIPDLPILAAILKVVPAKWALVAKFGLQFGLKFLMSYIKGRLEHPNVSLEGVDALVEVLSKALIDSSDVSFLHPNQPAMPTIIEFEGARQERIRIFPKWNSVEVG